MNRTLPNPHALSEDPPIVFAQERAEPAELTTGHPWKVLIADDDNEIHDISVMVLRDFTFEGRKLQFLSSHSGETTKRLMAENPDVALLLLDVVMETDDAGLDAVRYIRETLKNDFVRIVLRTGQPGQAPEKWVVIHYDINDYKEKTELTAQKLVTTVVSALRAYRDIQIIERSRQGLEEIITASRSLFEPQSLAQFSAGVLTQLTALLHLGEDSLYMQSSGFAARRDIDRGPDDFCVLAGTGQYAASVGRPVSEAIPATVLKKLLRASELQQTLVDGGDFVGYFRTSSGSENLVYLQTKRNLSELEVNLLRVFSANVAIAFDNVYLNEELTDTQVELIHTLAEVVETRSHETGHHVYRVGEYSRLLAELIGIPPRECDVLRMASPLHDLGKIGIPDALLNKPGRHTPEESAVMKTHASLGHSILKGSKRLHLRSAATIALEHHEWWDGSGYPQGLKGEDIHVFGRIVALADVFDALSHARSYKPAWPMKQVLEYIRGQSGTHFDPKLVDTLIDNLDAFLVIFNKYPDVEVPHEGNSP